MDSSGFKHTFSPRASVSPPSYKGQSPSAPFRRSGTETVQPVHAGGNKKGGGYDGMVVDKEFRPLMIAVSVFSRVNSAKRDDRTKG